MMSLKELKKELAHALEVNDIAAITRISEQCVDNHRELERELCHAAKTGDITTILRLIDEEGVDVNYQVDFTTPLSSALNGNQSKACQLLIDRGATLYCTSERNREYLVEKIRNADHDIIKRVQDVGGILYKYILTTMDGIMDDFYTACIRGNLRKARQLFETGKIDISKCKDDKKSVLSQSAYNGYLEVVKFLVANGASIEPDNGDYSALHNAAMRGHLEVVKFLVEKGADVNKVYDGKTPLMEAARCGQLKVARWLVEAAEADPNISVSNTTALIVAIEYMHYREVQEHDEYNKDIVNYLLKVSTW